MAKSNPALAATVTLPASNSWWRNSCRPSSPCQAMVRRAQFLGALSPVALTPEMDTAVLVNTEAAQRFLGPETPRHVTVSRPSDARKARQAAETSFGGLLLGLGGVVLLVGGFGVAHTW
ncbi:hypothetical protein ACFZAV_38770 [Streptomyces sp. NPDC008343]|uniref:hypothetical protein n=1 Tax=Streptomyces sp. NPDC008343 TaxID=3364828 RepID=UPI0036E88EB1